MDIAVQRMSQAGKVLYLGHMAVGDMLDSCAIDTWDPAKLNLDDQGYQRELLETHVASIYEWLMGEKTPFIPNGALLSARESDAGALKFKIAAKLGDSSFGTLTIPTGHMLYIVDYQHRWHGLRRAIEKGRRDDLRSFQVPVTIMADVTRREETIQFYLINSKQRRIDTDLALAIIKTISDDTNEHELIGLVGRQNKFRIRGVEITYKVALKKTGPWAGKIRLPHEPREERAVLKTKSFTDSLQPILSSRSPVAALSDTRLRAVIEAYWDALCELMNEASESPQSFSLQKTPGVFTLHIVAAKTVFRLCAAANDFTAPTMKKYLAAANDKVTDDPTRYFESDFWRERGPVKQYSSSGGHRTLATLIRKKIEAKHG